MNNSIFNLQPGLLQFDLASKRNRRINAILLCVVIFPISVGCVQLPTWNKSSNDRPTGSLNESQESLDVKFSLARLVERKGKMVEAQGSYLEILESEPEYAPAFHRLGAVAVKLEQLDQAIEYFQTAIQLDPDSPEVLGDLGYTYFLKGNYPKAEEFLSQALLLAPENHRIINNLAIVMGYQGKIHECMTLFRRANSESSALTNVGYVFSQTGDYENASRYFHKALNLDPGLEEAANGLVEIYKIKQLVTRPGFEPLDLQVPEENGIVAEIIAGISDKQESRFSPPENDQSDSVE